MEYDDDAAREPASSDRVKGQTFLFYSLCREVRTLRRCLDSGFPVISWVSTLDVFKRNLKCSVSPTGGDISEPPPS